MAKIAIKDKKHLGGGTYDVLAQFKFTQAQDGLRDKDDGGQNIPHFHSYTYRVSINLADNPDRPTRKQRLLDALKPVALSYKNQTLLARASIDAASDTKADLNVDTDDGTDVGAI
jgi:hypothetical protein